MAATPSEDHLQWNGDAQLGAYGYRETYLRVWLAFEFLSLVFLLGFFVWSFFIRQPRADSSKPLPMKALVGSILGFICARITNIIVIFLIILEKMVKNSYIVIAIFNLIFYLISFILGFFVFWYLIHKLLERIAEGSPKKSYRIVAIVHWVFLAIMTAIAVAVCIVYIASIVEGFFDFGKSFILTISFSIISSALDIIFWVASMEILGWIIFIFVKAGTEKRTGVPAIAIGTFFFFLINLILVIIQITYVLEMHVSPQYLDAAQGVMEFICLVGVYTGVMLGLQQWSRSGFISEPKNTIEDYERQMVINDSGVSSTASIQSHHATFHSQHTKDQQQMRYAVPEGAAASQQVHMWT